MRTKFLESELDNPPLVSIVTPSYNQARFLEQSIRSVLEQDYPRIEYIICDGGSTDHSVDIIRKYADRLAYWTSEKDDGQSDAINKGFAKAKGQIFGWLNSDDCYLQDCVSTIVTAFANNPDRGMIYGRVEIIDDQGRTIGEHHAKPYKFADLLTQKMIIPQQAAFWRSRVFDAVGGLQTDLHFAMDWEYWIRIGLRYPILAVNRILAQYRWSDINKGGTQAGGWGPEFLRILDNLYGDPSLSAKLSVLKRAAYAGAYLRGATNYLTGYDISQSRSWLVRAATIYPPILTSTHWWSALLKSLIGGRTYRWGRSVKSMIRESR